MKYRLTILNRARADIDRNADWWADHHSIEEAVFWSDSIYDQLETLTEFPESYGQSVENDLFPYELRDKLVGLGSRLRYRAIFTIRNDEVFVLAVRAAEEDRLTPEDVDFEH